MPRRIAAYLLCLASTLFAEEKLISKPGAVILDEDYSKTEAAGRWTTVGGHWAVKDGVLMGTVAGRKSPHLVYVCRYQNIVLTTRFQLVDNVGMLIRFQGMKGARTLGILVSRDAILVNKLQARDDTHTEKNKLADLGRVTHRLDVGRWYDLTMRLVGDELQVSIEGASTITVKNPDFDFIHEEVAVIFSGGVGYLRKLKAVVPGP